MKISYKGDYALKAVLVLAQNFGKEILTIQDLAEAIKAPKKFLEQVLLELKRGGFVESRRGNVGGYQLSRSPAQIRLGDVVQYIEGPVEPIACVNECYKNCEDLNTCVFRGIWRQVNTGILDIINNITFEDLVKKTGVREEALSYAI